MASSSLDAPVRQSPVCKFKKEHSSFECQCAPDQLDVRLKDAKSLKEGGRSALTQEILHRLLSYDLSTGIFKWKVAAGRTVKPGDVAGGPTDDGYTGIYIQRRRYGAHRLAWLYVYGVWPVDQIDHINRSRSDNRIANLRCATHRENMQNTTPVKNKSGVRGVYKNRNKWQASINVNGRFIHIGLYASKEEAGLAYISAKRMYHPKSHERMEFESAEDCEKFIIECGEKIIHHYKLWEASGCFSDIGEAHAYRIQMQRAISLRTPAHVKQLEIERGLS